MKWACFTIILLPMIVMPAGCGNKNASKQSEMQKPIQDTPAEERASVQDDPLADALSLTPEQRQEIGQINRKYAREVDSILHSRDWRSKKVKRFKSAMTNKDRELKKVFSKKQYEIYKQAIEDLKHRSRKRR